MKPNPGSASTWASESMRLMCFWRWWQIQGLDFIWLTGARNSVMHHRETIFLSWTLSGFEVISLITLRTSESQVKTCHCKYISLFLGSVLVVLSVHNPFSLISKEFNASNECNLLSSWCLFSLVRTRKKHLLSWLLFSIWLSF